MNKQNAKIIAVFLALAMIVSMVMPNVFADAGVPANADSAYGGISLRPQDGVSISAFSDAADQETITAEFEDSSHNHLGTVTISTNDHTDTLYGDSTRHEVFVPDMKEVTISLTLEDGHTGYLRDGDVKLGTSVGDFTVGAGQHPTFDVIFDEPENNHILVGGNPKSYEYKNNAKTSVEVEYRVSHNDQLQGTITFTSNESKAFNVTEAQDSKGKKAYDLEITGNITIAIQGADGHEFEVYIDGQKENNGRTLDLTSNMNIDVVADGGQNEGFDGTVIFVWTIPGDENLFYFHRFDGVQDPGEDSDYVNYVDADSFTADNDNSVKFDVTKQTRTYPGQNGGTEEGPSYDFVSSKFETEVLQIPEESAAFDQLSATEKMIYLREHDYSYNPLRAQNSANSVSTMGDHNFYMTIYRNKEDNHYEGVQIGLPDDYTYVPNFWDATFYQDTLDISGSTEEEPAVLESFLLEPTVTLGLSDVASNKPIVSIKPIGVPDKAVTVEKGTGDKWNITYHSNYYDHVELEITDEGGAKYYLVINRVNIRLQRAGNGPLCAAVYYPDSDKYSDYSVLMKIVNKDGTTTTKLLNDPAETAQEQDGTIVTGQNELYGGTKLKCTWYLLEGVAAGPNNTEIDSIYLTVLKDYDPTATTYGGTLAGADEGIQFKFNGRDFERVVK